MNTEATMNTTPEAAAYTTADELRDLLADAPHPDDLDEALACLPIDLEAFHARMAAAVASRAAASPAEAVSVVHEAIQACALPGHVIGAEFAALIDRAILTACQLKKAAAEHDRAELLADLAEGIRTRDADSLAVALGMAPFSSRAYVERLRTLADATGPGGPNDPDRLRAEQMEALKASATPGTVLDDELAGAILDALNVWSAIQTETPEQRAIRKAFSEARRLIDLHGEEDHRAFAAIVKAVNLQDPGFLAAGLKQCGITMPAPTHCAEDGTRLYSLDSIADALGADVGELQAIAEDMEAVGLEVRHAGPASVHTLQ